MQTADAYLTRYANDRNGLIRFVRDHSGLDAGPGRLHAAIAQAGFRAIVTAWYDEGLEQALKAAGYRVNCVVRDKQLPYTETGARDVVVIKLYGGLSDPESLALTAWDHAQLLVRLSQKLKIVTAFCARRSSWASIWPMSCRSNSTRTLR